MHCSACFADGVGDPLSSFLSFLACFRSLSLGSNSSTDSGPELREQATLAPRPQQFWPNALNPGGLEAEPPYQRMLLFRIEPAVSNAARTVLPHPEVWPEAQRLSAGLRSASF
jgi:hypothetical protein